MKERPIGGRSFALSRMTLAGKFRRAGWGANGQTDVGAEWQRDLGMPFRSHTQSMPSLRITGT